MRTNDKKVTATEINIVILQPHFSSTSPAISAEKIAPNGVALAEKKLKVCHSHKGTLFQRFKCTY